MNFKKSREEVVQEAYYKADRAMRTILYGGSSPSHYNPYGDPTTISGPVAEQLMHAMSYAIAEAVRSIVENTYTDADFEEDMGLNK